MSYATLVTEIRKNKWSSQDLQALRRDNPHISTREWNKALLAAFQ